MYGEDGTVPFVKYQLLATMRSLSEKVASQYAARVRNASFSAAYGLILDVPRSASYTDCWERAKDLAQTYGRSRTLKKALNRSELTLRTLLRAQISRLNLPRFDGHGLKSRKKETDVRKEGAEILHGGV